MIETKERTTRKIARNGYAALLADFGDMGREIYFLAFYARNSHLTFDAACDCAALSYFIETRTTF